MEEIVEEAHTKPQSHEEETQSRKEEVKAEAPVVVKAAAKKAVVKKAPAKSPVKRSAPKPAAVQSAVKKPAEVMADAVSTPEQAYLAEHASDPGMVQLPAAVAALAILAAKRMNHRFADENDNEAERQHDGSVRLSIKQREGGHVRIYVRVPDLLDLIVCDGPVKLSPE